MKDDGVLFAIAICTAVILGWGWPLIKEYWLIAVAWVAKLMKGAGTDETQWNHHRLGAAAILLIGVSGNACFAETVLIVVRARHWFQSAISARNY